MSRREAEVLQQQAELEEYRKRVQADLVVSASDEHAARHRMGFGTGQSLEPAIYHFRNGEFANA